MTAILLFYILQKLCTKRNELRYHAHQCRNIHANNSFRENMSYNAIHVHAE
jgi:hypothetical protein